GYEDLYKWSIENICEFWAENWDFLGVISSKRFDKVVDLNIPMNEFPKWFEGAELNYAENLLKYRDDKPALIVDGQLESRVVFSDVLQKVFEIWKGFACIPAFKVRNGSGGGARLYAT
ncbi:acetoacetyl-CoA synthetase, partial [Nephila pilipes]